MRRRAVESTINTIVRLQDYFRRSASQRYETISVPPFSLFIHSTDDFPGYNYAIPDRPIVGGVHQALLHVKRACRARQRQPRFEFVEEYTPQFPSLLAHERWTEEGRHILMTCTPDTWRPAAAVDRLKIHRVRAGDAGEVVRQFITVQRLGFSPADTETVGEDEIERFRPTLANGSAFLAFADGVPAGVAMYTTPLEGSPNCWGSPPCPLTAGAELQQPQRHMRCRQLSPMA